MPAFSEQIQSLYDTIFTSKCARTLTVAGLKTQTEQLLKADHQFLQAVHDENRAVAEQDKADRLGNCRERSEQMRVFRERIQREQVADAEQQRQELEQSQQDRQEAVKTMRDAFNETQRAFAHQCQAASEIWRQMPRCRTGKH